MQEPPVHLHRPVRPRSPPHMYVHTGKWLPRRPDQGHAPLAPLSPSGVFLAAFLALSG